MLKRWIALILILAVWMVPIAAGSNVAALTTRQKLADAAQKQATLDTKLDKLAREQAQLNKSKNNLSGELAWLNDRTDEQKEIYVAKSEQLQAALAELNEAYADYIQSEQDLEAKQQQYVQRLQVMYEHRKQSMLEFFLEAKSLQGFFTVVQFMAIIEETDQQMIDNLQSLTDDAKIKQKQADQKAEEMQAVVGQLEADLARLKADAAATRQDMKELDAKISAQDAAENALEAESKRIGQDIYTLQKKLAAERAATATAQAKRKSNNKPSTPVVKNGWTWPVPGHKYITSKYGNRLHPVYKVYRMHSGIDISAPYGSSVVSARAGTVLMVVNPVQGQNSGGSGYGNYIVVDHGDGYSTLYAHLKRTLVSKGQTVRAGSRIGLVGSTGTSTGAHLHFEVRINGDTVNPSKYVS